MDNLEAWSYGASIITFLVPMLAFAAVALTLLVLYTKPETVPGRRSPRDFAIPIIATRYPGKPARGTDGSKSGDRKTEESASE